MNMLSIRDTLMWYKRPDVRKAMVEGARGKEVGFCFGEGYGKRPDALDYEEDILHAVQRGATSFHASEEIWSNPRSIETGMSKERGNELRTGWDLILDVDFAHFEATKIITESLCCELEAHGVKHYSVKFSGNKGFHIGVPWEAFPQEFGGAFVSALFPDAARTIANFLVFAIDNPDNNFALSEKLLTIIRPEQAEQHRKVVCAACGVDRKDKRYERYFVCPRCSHNERRPAEYDEILVCPRCRSIMDPIEHEDANIVAARP